MKINNVRGWGDSLKEYNVKAQCLLSLENIDEVNSLFLDMEGGELIFFQEYKDYITKNITRIFCINIVIFFVIADNC